MVVSWQILDLLYALKQLQQYHLLQDLYFLNRDCYFIDLRFSPQLHQTSTWWALSMSEHFFSLFSFLPSFSLVWSISHSLSAIPSCEPTVHAWCFFSSASPASLLLLPPLSISHFFHSSTLRQHARLLRLPSAHRPWSQLSTSSSLAWAWCYGLLPASPNQWRIQIFAPAGDVEKARVDAWRSSSSWGG